MSLSSIQHIRNLPGRMLALLSFSSLLQSLNVFVAFMWQVFTFVRSLSCMFACVQDKRLMTFRAGPDSAHVINGSNRNTCRSAFHATLVGLKQRAIFIAACSESLHLQLSCSIDVGVITYKVDLPSTGLSTMSLQPEDFNPSCKGNHVSQQPLDT